MIDDLHDQNRKKDRFLSNITAKSLQKGEGYSSLPRKGMVMSLSFPIWRIRAKRARAPLIEAPVA